MKAKDFIPASKPRNPVVRQQQTSGAGAHRDKKKEQKQGQVKHKGRMAEGADIGKEWMSDTELDQYVPDRLQDEWRELVGYDIEGKAHPLWANMTGGYEPDVNDPEDRANMVKVANKWFSMKKIPNVKFYDVKDADDELEWLVQIGEKDVEEGIGGTIAGGVGQFIGNKIDPLHGEIMRAHGEIAGRKAEYTIRKYMHLLQKALKQQLDSGDGSNESTEEGRKDYGYDSFGNSLRPGSDEGSTEPPNNFAIYINGKKWKVFQGRGQYADDQYEMQQFRQLQAMAARKSQETGKKWEVARTGEPATK